MQARDLVLSSQLSSPKLIRFLRHFGFENPQRADSHLQSIAESLGEREPLADFSGSLLDAISRTPDQFWPGLNFRQQLFQSRCVWFGPEPVESLKSSDRFRLVCAEPSH